MLWCRAEPATNIATTIESDSAITGVIGAHRHKREKATCTPTQRGIVHRNKHSCTQLKLLEHFSSKCYMYILFYCDWSLHLILIRISHILYCITSFCTCLQTHARPQCQNRDLQPATYYQKANISLEIREDGGGVLCPPLASSWERGCNDSSNLPKIQRRNQYNFSAKWAPTYHICHN